MSVPKVTCQCGTVFNGCTTHMVVHREKDTTAHRVYECSCGAEPEVTTETAKKIDDWDGAAQYLEIAREVGKKIGQPGDYYKPGCYGFTWFNGKVVAIILFLRGEPEITPIRDGFGPLNELVIEEEAI